MRGSRRASLKLRVRLESVLPQLAIICSQIRGVTTCSRYQYAAEHTLLGTYSLGYLASCEISGGEGCALMMPPQK